MKRKRFVSFSFCDSFDDPRQPEDEGDLGHLRHVRSRVQGRGHTEGKLSADTRIFVPTLTRFREFASRNPFSLSVLKDEREDEVAVCDSRYRNSHEG